MNTVLFEVSNLVEKSLPGRRKLIETFATGEPEAEEGVVVTYEVDDYNTPTLWHVFWVRIEDSGEREMALTTRYHYTTEDAFHAGVEANELTRGIKKGKPSPPSNDTEYRIAMEEMRHNAEALIRRRMMRELKEEGRKLKEGQTHYPPSESLLGEILAGIGALPGRE